MHGWVIEEEVKDAALALATELELVRDERFGLIECEQSLSYSYSYSINIIYVRAAAAATTITPFRRVNLARERGRENSLFNVITIIIIYFVAAAAASHFFQAACC